jgi:hypothetical protein
MSIVHQRIVDPRLNFELFCDWLKTGHVVCLLFCDSTIAPPILFSEGQLLFGVLHSCYVRSKNAKSSSSSSPLKNPQKFAKIRLINYLDINFYFLMNSLDAIIITLLDK